MRLVASILIDIDEEWSTTKKYLSMGRIDYVWDNRAVQFTENSAHYREGELEIVV
jgi:hypothetical protein